jgi:hypothetical protein
VNSVLCASVLPHIAHRNWAFAKEETMKWKEDGTLDLLDLVGADKLDPGNYKAGLGPIRALFASASAEFGDERIKKEMLRQLDEEYHPVFRTKTGALKNKGLSTIEQGTTLRARMCGFQDWVQLITKGPPEITKKGPLLSKVSFPEVLVAKAYSHDGQGMELVLYPGREGGMFQVGFERLRPGETYTLGGQRVVASSAGEAAFDVPVDGRTVLQLEAWSQK